jgi:hypothetical protein
MTSKSGDPEVSFVKSAKLEVNFQEVMNSVLKSIDGSESLDRSADEARLLLVVEATGRDEL